MIGTGTDADPRRPNVAGDYVMVGERGNRALVKTVVPDGTPPTATTIADLTDGGLDVNADALTAGQRNTIKTFLTNQGIDAAQFDADGVTDRRALLRFLARRWLGREDFQTLIDGYAVGSAT
jgi:hypothetical protein